MRVEADRGCGERCGFIDRSWRTAPACASFPPVRPRCSRGN